MSFYQDMALLPIREELGHMGIEEFIDKTTVYIFHKTRLCYLANLHIHNLISLLFKNILLVTILPHDKIKSYKLKLIVVSVTPWVIPSWNIKPYFLATNFNDLKTVKASLCSQVNGRSHFVSANTMKKQKLRDEPNGNCRKFEMQSNWLNLRIDLARHHDRQLWFPLISVNLNMHLL